MILTGARTRVQGGLHVLLAVFTVLAAFASFHT
jgi:hypothetical protein